MELTIIQVLKYLQQNNYLTEYKGIYGLSPAFNQAVKKAKELQMKVPEAPPPLVTTLIGNTTSESGIVKNTNVSIKKIQTDTLDWRLAFTKFIIEAKVPKYLPDGKGGSFEANKYNEKAMLVFQSMMTKENIDYPILVKATILYYKSASSFKKKIANYIIDGDWRTDYSNLSLAVQGGEDRLRKHIKDELNNGEYSPYSY